MNERYQNVYQFKITLRDVTPPVGRHVQVPETYTFWDLHVAIQDAMGWSDCHLHDFKLRKSGAPANDFLRLGIPEDGALVGEQDIADWTVRISDWFLSESTTATYTYDFGDNWTHAVAFEERLPRERGATYPRCVAGKRACPPEDCGGPWGYADLLKIIRNPRRREHKEMMEWLGGPFNAEAFDPQEVMFDDPRKRLRELLKSHA